MPYPVYDFLISGASYTQLILVQILFAILISTFSGAGPAAIAEMFPTRSALDLDDIRVMRSRSRSSAASRRSSRCVLIDQIGSLDRAQLYLIAAAVASTVVIAMMRETAHEASG